MIIRQRELLLAVLAVVGLATLGYRLTRATAPGAGGVALPDESTALSGGWAGTGEEPLLVEPLARGGREPDAVGRAPQPPTPAAGTDATQVSEEPTSGIAVKGVVRFSGDGVPAAGVSFVLHHAGGRVIVEADGDGRFATEPVVQPGIASLVHRTRDAAPPYTRRLRFAPASVTVPAASGEEVHVALTLLRPEAVLLVNVVHPNGRAAPGASVELELQHEPHAGEFTHRTEVAEVQDDGRASFTLYDLEHLRAAGVGARLEQVGADRVTRVLVSEQVRLEVPVRPELLETPVRLVLDAAGSLLVRVADTSGIPVPGQRIWTSTGDAFLTAGTGSPAPTDERGEVMVSGLAPREYIVGLIDGPSGSRRAVTVDAGAISEVQFVVPVGGARIAVAGRVVDEAGDPLAGVQIHVTYGPGDSPGDTSASSATDAEGRFEFRAPPRDGVSVTANRDIFGDEFEPDVLDLPFGSTDALFRRVRKLPSERVVFEIVDAASGARLPGALVMTYRAPDTRDYSFHRAQGGVASPLCPVHPATTLVVELAGYRRATLRLEELLSQEPAQGLRRVALERGVLRTLRVNGDDGDGQSRALRGARIEHEGRLLGRTDGAGEFIVDLLTWPEGGLSIEGEGYSPAIWLPTDDFAELDPAWVWLERE